MNALETQRDALLAKLRDANLDPAEREALEVETAAVLREIDETVPANPFLASAMKGFAWGVAVFAILAALGYMVVTSASPRDASPAPSLTDQQRLDRAQQELDRDNLMGVFEETKAVLEHDPENSRALTLQAMVRAAMNEGDRATAMLQRATKSDPRNLDARVALAWVHAQNGRMPEAEKTIALAIKEVPSEKALLEKVLQQIKTRR
jgi:cytochrome c-type biogenesis protein CcmH/NrfG